MTTIHARQTQLNKNTHKGNKDSTVYSF